MLKRSWATVQVNVVASSAFIESLGRDNFSLLSSSLGISVGSDLDLVGEEKEAFANPLLTAMFPVPLSLIDVSSLSWGVFGHFWCYYKRSEAAHLNRPIPLRKVICQEDVNGEKLTVKKWWIFGADFSRFGADFFTVYADFSRFVRDINGEKSISLSMSFFTVSFSRFAPSRICVRGHPTK